MVNWWGISSHWKPVVKFWFPTQNDEDVLYSLGIRQAQWNSTLQKHTNGILKSTILCYPRKVFLKSTRFRWIIQHKFVWKKHLLAIVMYYWRQNLAALFPTQPLGCQGDVLSRRRVVKAEHIRALQRELCRYCWTEHFCPKFYLRSEIITQDSTSIVNGWDFSLSGLQCMVNL